ncbi:ABC transporter permease [Candidatus Poribacteria bacterium]|nr:ABC transporter permease [Candidatus Poribacteria bacterium]
MLLKGVGHLFVANARMFFRVRQEIFWVFFLPVFLLILLGLVLKDVAGIGSMRAEDVHFPIGVVDNDRTQTSRRFIDTLRNAPEFSVKEFSQEEGMAQAQSAEQRVVVVFPDGFENALWRSEAKIEVVVDSRSLPLTEMALNIMRERIDMVLATDGQAARPGKALAGGEGRRGKGESGPAVGPVKLPVRFTRTKVRTVEEFFDFIDFLIPGVMAMAVMTSCIFSLAPTIVRLREQGVMRRLWVTPLSRLSFVASHVFFRLFIAMAQTLLIVVVAFSLFKTNLVLPMASILVFLLLGNLNGTALSFVIAGFAKTPEVASTIANVVSIPMLMLCGVFLPLEIMPKTVLPFIRALPLTHLSEGLRQLMNAQKDFTNLWPSQLILTAYLLGFFLIGIVTFKWDKSTANSGR